MPLLTVIMPVYNGEKFLKESIDSVLNQTFSDFKLLVLDDNSQDQTAKILEDYQHKDSRIEVITKSKNVGPANLRNEGIEIAKTEFIALLDADDIALPTRFEKQIDFLNTNSEYGVCGTWFTFFGDKENKTIKHHEAHDTLKVEMLSNCCIGNPTVMFKKSHLGDLRFDNQYVPAEDYGLWSQLIANTKFHNIQESLLFYRWHPNNISQTKADNLRTSEVLIRAKQLEHIGIQSTDPDLDFYVNTVSLQRKQSSESIIKTIKAANKLIELNKKQNYYNQAIFEKHIEKIIVRSIRNAKHFDKFLYRYIKNESEYFSKIPTIDALLLYMKSYLKIKS